MRGKARISALWGAPKPVRFLAVVKGKYMQLSRRKPSASARSTK